MTEYTFTWRCQNCATKNIEYVVEGSPSLEILCEKCGRVTVYEECTTETQVQWDITREQSMRG